MTSPEAASQTPGERGAPPRPPGAESPPAGVASASVLCDLPASSCGALLRALRRAIERVPLSDLPPRLRPFAAWTPDALAGARPRAAVAEALRADAQLRDELSRALDGRAAAAIVDAERMDAQRLVAAHGVEAAVAALAARGDWNAVAVAGAASAELRAARHRGAAEAVEPPGTAGGTPATPGRAGGTPATPATPGTAGTAGDSAAALRRRAEAAEAALRSAERRAERAGAAAARAAAERDELAERVRRLTDDLADADRRHRKRLARLRRRVEEAEARAEVDSTRVARVAGELARWSADLAAAVGGDGAPPAGSTATPLPYDRPDSGAEVGAGPAATVPRDARAASPGRPCGLPGGVLPGTPEAVLALLQVPGLEVLVDGYNVTKDLHGKPTATLEDQRRWLVRLAAGVAARFDHRLVLVFDGSEAVAAPAAGVRGVAVVFTRDDEIADERLVAMVDALAPDQPVLVVSSDREVAAACAARGADVAPSAAFLRAVA